MKSVSTSERIRRDNAEGAQLFEQVKDRLLRYEDGQIRVTLLEVSERLGQNSDSLKDSHIETLITRGDVARAFPGVWLAVPARILTEVELESELAAVLAWQLAFIAQRVALSEIELNPRVDPLEATRVRFNFPEKTVRDLIRTAVGMMYRAQYDPRALALLWKKWPGLSPSQTDSLKDFTYLEIQNLPPLLKPRAQSDRFLEFRKRVISQKRALQS